MADPVTLLTIAGAATSAIGFVQAAAAAEASGNYNAQLADRDAFVAGQNRQATAQQTRIAAEDKRRETRRRLSSIRAQYGAAGVQLTGSPLDVLEDSAIEGEQDAQRVEYEGRVAARSGALEMLGFSEEATLSRMNASTQRRAGNINAVAALTSGTGTALSRQN